MRVISPDAFFHSNTSWIVESKHPLNIFSQVTLLVLSIEQEIKERLHYDAIISIDLYCRLSVKCDSSFK